MNAPKVDGLSVIAVVSMNGGEGLVLNRALNFIYSARGSDYIGTDGPFKDVLYYERGRGRFVAFAGRPITITLEDGTQKVLKDHWWSGHLKGFVSIPTGDIESLRKCYVFRGGSCISPADLADLRSTYTGPVYPYWDYEKIVRAQAVGGAA